ncbi:MAG: hypothetical protein DME59_16725, partial [Verrucomicrobia bacterium]
AQTRSDFARRFFHRRPVALLHRRYSRRRSRRRTSLTAFYLFSPANFSNFLTNFASKNPENKVGGTRSILGKN